MSKKIRLQGETPRYVLITLTLLIFLFALAYTFFSSHLMINKYAPLIDATMEIKLEATTAHLWLEEKLSGDRYEDFDKIVQHIEEARWYANAMLEGGKNPEGTFIPLKDKNLRNEIEKAVQELDALKKITFERYNSIGSSGIGTDVDQQYDKLFTTFIDQVDHVETLLQQKIKEDFSRYQFIQILLITAVFIFGFITLYAQYKYDRAKKEAIYEIQEARLQAEESENWLKTTMNSMGDGVIITDHQGLVTYLNPVASSLTGWRINDAKFKKMTEVFNIVNEYTKEPVEDPVEMVIRKNVVVGLANHTELISKDGTKWPIADSAAPIFDKDNNLLGVVVVFHEITAQKKAESEKALLESQLRQAFKMEAIGTMAGGIAHDFNNILAIILGSADMARDDIPKESPARHNVEQVLIAANRAKELVKQILAFSRQEPEKKEALYLCRFIEENMKSLRSTVPSSVKLNVNVPAKCHTDITQCNKVLVDPVQINQLLMNLTVNAVHAMDESGVLEINITDVSYNEDDIPLDRIGLEPGDYECLTFSDTGSGMSREVMNQVFDPFFTTKEVGQGTGMGLSVVHGIIQGHEGKIYVDSELGSGTTFYIYFPVTDQLPEQDHAEVLARPTGNERILFVDDEEMLADMGKKLIERQGYQVTVQNDSTEALQLFKNAPEQFDLVITDQTMPNMTGAELAEQILQIRPGMPIILCTGYSSKVDKDSAKKIGISEFASKPLDRNYIAKVIRNVLDKNDLA